ncbi:MAG TPA: hypothetical protein VGL86_19860 [Polyangia bacterium]
MIAIALGACGGAGVDGGGNGGNGGNDAGIDGGPLHCGGPHLDLSVPDGAPCIRDSDCEPTPEPAPNGAFGARVCAYKIADGCAATGHCASLPSPTCASFTELCGCDGNPVRAGACFYADGYAGGPTTGASVCGDDGGT